MNLPSGIYASKHNTVMPVVQSAAVESPVPCAPSCWPERSGACRAHHKDPVREGGASPRGAPSISRPPVRPFIVAPKFAPSPA
jgi:hypothetical protein